MENAREEKKKKGKNYLFVIALDEYKDPNQNLDNVVRGSATVVHYLTKYYAFHQAKNGNPLHTEEDSNIKKYKGKITDFPLMEYFCEEEIKPADLAQEELDGAREKIQTYTLYNEKATFENFNKHLGLLLGDNTGHNSLLTADDNLLIYFSGHGSYDFGVLELQLYDRLFDVSRLAGRINNAKKENGKNKPKNIFVVLDCCNSGSIDLGSSFKYDKDISISRRFITSTYGAEDASGGSDEDLYTPFAEAFIRCLNDFEVNFNSFDLSVKISSLMAKKTDNKQIPKYGNLPRVDKYADYHFPFNMRQKLPLPITFKQELMKLNYSEQSDSLKFKRGVDLEVINRLLLISIHADCKDTLDYIYQFIFHKYRQKTKKKLGLNPRHRIIRLRLGIVDNREKSFHNQLGVYLLGIGEEYKETEIIEILIDCMKEYNVILLCDFEDYSNEIYARELTQIRLFLKMLSIRLNPSFKDGIIENGLVVFVRDKTDNSDLYQTNNNLEKEILEALNFNYCHTPIIQNIKIPHIVEWWNNDSNSLKEDEDYIDEFDLDDFNIQDNRLDLNGTLKYITSKIGYEGQALTKVMDHVFNNPNTLSINFDEYE